MNRSDVGRTVINDLRNKTVLASSIPIKIDVAVSPWSGEFVNSIQIWLDEGYSIDIQISKEIYKALGEKVD